MTELPQLNLSTPAFDESRFDAVLMELQSLRISPPADLASKGLNGMNEWYAKIEANLARVCELHIEAIDLKAKAEAVFEAFKGNYEAQRAVLLSTQSKDAFESIKQIEALVDQKLAEQKRLMTRAKINLGLYKAHLKKVEQSVKQLESAKKTIELQNNNLKRQIMPAMTNQGMFSPK